MGWVIGTIIYIAIGCLFLGIGIITLDEDNLTKEEQDNLTSVIALWPIFLLIFIGAFIADKLLKKK